MPDHLIGIRPENKSGRIQRIVIEEGKRLLYRSFDGSIMLCVLCLFYGKVHMELRSRSPAVFFLHMVPAWHRRIIHIFQKPFHLVESDPVLRIFGMVVITIHHDDIRLQEVTDIAVVLLKLSAHMVKPDRFLQVIPRLDLFPVRIQAVLRIRSHVCRL